MNECGLPMHFTPSRILKEAMRAGGSHITPEHAEDISLCGLFLMEVTKRVDREYSVHNGAAHTVTNSWRDWPSISRVHNGAAHTATNSWRDIVKLAEHIPSANIRSKTSFADPTLEGLKKMTTTTWIQYTLNRNEQEAFSSMSLISF